MNNVAIIGSGKSAKNFIKAINKSADFKLIQIGSRNLKAAKKLSLISNSKVEINTVNKIIKSKLNNLVIICLPGYIQPKIIKSIFLYKKNIICEKPFALKYSHAKEVFDKWKKTKKICVINFCYRFLNPLNFVLKEIKKNKSKIHTIKTSWNVLSEKKNKINWKNKYNLSGGVLFNYGSHLLNLFFPIKKKLVISIDDNNIPFKFCSFSLKKKITYNFFLSNISDPPHGIKIELIGKKYKKIISNYGSSGPTEGFKLNNYSFNKKKIINNKLLEFDKKKIDLSDLYLQTLKNFNKIKKKRLRKYKNDINEGLWNTYLLEKIQNKIKKIY